MKKIFNKIIKKSKIIGFLIIFFITVMGLFLQDLKLDASSETLLLKNDSSLEFTRKINEKYNNQDFLVITYKPKTELLNENNIDFIIKLQEELFNNVNSIESINSIINVPLLQSPVIGISELANDIPTLKKYYLNKELTKEKKELIYKEFQTSPLYKNNLVSNDLSTTAILLNLKNDKKYFDLIKERKNNPNNSNINQEIKDYREYSLIKQKKEIDIIRNILKNNSNKGELFLGGVGMIQNDIIEFLKNDITSYGITLFLIFVFLLYILFKNITFVFMTLFISIISVILSTSLISLLGIEITVISSNFISLQLILTISLVIHLIIQYTELVEKYPQYKDKNFLIILTLMKKLSPSLFAILTTLVGFSSLMLADILPVVNLGIMMSISVLISLILTFIFFPIIMVNFYKNNKDNFNEFIDNLLFFCIYTINNKSRYIIYIVFILLSLSIIGISNLIVENSFINYFKSNTEIYKSMITIDKNLGGTTPLDIIINLKDNEKMDDDLKIVQTDVKKDDFDNSTFFDDFSDEFDEVGRPEYWFTQDKLKIIKEIHNYLLLNENIGYVQSISTILELGKILNKDKDLDSFSLGLLYKNFPEKYKDILLNPYLNIEDNQLRFSVRIIDSNKDLRRNILLKELQTDIKNILKDKGEVKLSNLMLLYNNMLQSLFSSQIKTLSVVAIFIFFMFLITFKNIKVSLISLISNIIPITIIFGLMGWLKIPLDVMTITIAAISIGIGVDDTIHYVHRFKEEYKNNNNDYRIAIENTHYNLGKAIIYTTVIIMIGFSILIFSNIIPTIYFGILTMFVMLLALLSTLFVLPYLLMKFNVYNNE